MTSIPKDINEVYEELKTEITWVHGRWIVYRQLFAESEKRIDLLNECASAFFYIIQDVLLGEVQVSLSKLTDPAQSGKFKNLSLEQLQERLDAHGDKDLANQTRSILDRLHSKCTPFRVWRNKQLAHLDLTTAMKCTQNTLPGISRQKIEEALELVREFMNKIEGHYMDSEMGYEHFSMQSDGEALVAMLRYGLRYEELLKDGKVSYDDWHHGKWHDA
ncbi:MAG: hypothetical protein JRG74_15055 [Deltaproteobacteria bacterium]|nr:hypothetical protein [Deltaproteobacteria bacterium]MBW2167346.1 hypothetical protein [Deltaproteobacteria bacterium]